MTIPYIANPRRILPKVQTTFGVARPGDRSQSDWRYGNGDGNGGGTGFGINSRGPFGAGEGVGSYGICSDGTGGLGHDLCNADGAGQGHVRKHAYYIQHTTECVR